MTYQPRFRFEQRDQTGGFVFDGADPIAEIRELRLCNVALTTVGLPLANSPQRGIDRGAWISLGRLALRCSTSI